MYRKREDKPTAVNVTLEKMNPRLQLMAAKTLVLRKDGDEKTAFRFTITKSGDIKNISSLAKIIASKHIGPYDYYDPDLQDPEPYDYEENYDGIPEDDSEVPPLNDD